MQTARGLEPSRAVLRRAAKGGKPSAIPITAGRRVHAHQQKHPSRQGCRGSRGTAGEIPGGHQHQHSCWGGGAGGPDGCRGGGPAAVIARVAMGLR